MWAYYGVDSGCPRRWKDLEARLAAVSAPARIDAAGGLSRRCAAVLLAAGWTPGSVLLFVRRAAALCNLPQTDG